MKTLCNGVFMAFIKTVKGFPSNFMRTQKSFERDEWDVKRFVPQKISKNSIHTILFATMVQTC